jgi:1-deoxyxylulose-5-phosphate synthase
MITDPKSESGPFSSVYLNRSGVRASRICLGTMTFGVQLDLKTSHRLLDMAFEKGIFYFDTANAYSSGESERILGQWCRDRRTQVVISSKVRYQVGNDPMSVGLSRRTLMKEVEKSLARLQTDYIDILYLHQPDSSTEIAETLRAVDDLIHQGKVLVLGVSNFAAWQIMEAHCEARISHFSPPLVVQPMYNLIARGIEQELLPCCKSLNLAVYAYNPLAAGLLTGKHDRTSGVTSGGRFELFPYYVDRYWTERGFQAVDSLKRLAEECGRSLISLSLQWVMDQPGITGLIIGASSERQLAENLSAFQNPLHSAVLQECDKIWREFRGPVPSYNR